MDKKTLTARLNATLYGVKMNTDDARALGRLIGGHRRAKGLTQRQAADLTRLPLGAIAGAETGRQVPRAPAMASICEALDLTIEEIQEVLREA